MSAVNQVGELAERSEQRRGSNCPKAGEGRLVEDAGNKDKVLVDSLTWALSPLQPQVPLPPPKPTSCSQCPHSQSLGWSPLFPWLLQALSLLHHSTHHPTLVVLSDACVCHLSPGCSKTQV